MLTKKLTVFFALFVFIGLIGTRNAIAGTPCPGDLNCDGDVDGYDLAIFGEDFGGTDCVPCVPAPLPKTGQTTSYETGDDGDFEKGVAWPNPRFTDNGNGTVTDNLTGLIWLKDGNCFGGRTWDHAVVDCNNLAHGNCGLTDGSSAGDWRLPNIRELQSLLDYGQFAPAMPVGHPFIGNVDASFWSSTTHAGDTRYAWRVEFSYGFASGPWPKSSGSYVRAVRVGQ